MNANQRQRRSDLDQRKARKKKYANAKTPMPTKYLGRVVRKVKRILVKQLDSAARYEKRWSNRILEQEHLDVHWALVK